MHYLIIDFKRTWRLNHAKYSFEFGVSLAEHLKYIIGKPNKNCSWKWMCAINNLAKNQSCKLIWGITCGKNLIFNRIIKRLQRKISFREIANYKIPQHIEVLNYHLSCDRCESQIWTHEEIQRHVDRIGCLPKKRGD